jgi:hypothetical protein
MTARVIVIPNDTASATRTNINDALAALGSTNSGATEPPNSLNNMLWYDTANHLLKIKAETGGDWINIGYVDQSTDTFKILDDTVVTTAAGVDTNGRIGDQTTGTWTTGTGTTESLVSPAKVKAAIDALAPTQSTAAGDVGTYVFARGPLSTSGQQFVWNTTYAGTGLYPAGPSAFAGNTGSGSTWNTSGFGMAVGYYLAPALTGTWRCLGYTHPTYDNPVTLFVRIS